MNSSSDVGGSISEWGEKQDDSSQSELKGDETAEPLSAEVCCSSQVLTARVHQVHLFNRQSTTRLVRWAATRGITATRVTATQSLKKAP